MRFLLACEESQAVTIELRKMGIEAFSCDLQPCSGGYSEWHLQCDLFEVINDNWDCMIAFPPCTHIAISGARHFEKKRADGRQQAAIDFFLRVANAPIYHIAIENPMNIIPSIWRKADQVIQPYYFGDTAQKTTWLWLKNLPHLYHNSMPNLFDTEVTHVSKGEFYVAPSGKKLPKWYNHNTNNSDDRQKSRSVTFSGVAKAMAKQWGEYVFSKSLQLA